MENKKKDKETWKLWDSVFSSGLLSLFNDHQEAQTNDKKFKKLLLQLLFGLIFTIILFGLLYWILFK